MAEVFNVIFCSRGANVINASDLNNVVYMVNWGSILPKTYRKFRCQFIFKSETYAGNLSNCGFVSMDIGRTHNFDGMSNSRNIGVIYPVSVVAGTSSYYNATNNDNNDFYMDYPVNQSVTLGLKTFAGANMANMPNYTLILSCEGVPDDEIELTDTKNF